MTHRNPRAAADYPSRVILDLHPDDHRALSQAHARDRISMSDRVRALIGLWRSDGTLAVAVSTLAQQTPPVAPPVPGSPRRTVKRLTLDLTEDDHHALLGARYADRVTMSERLRALIGLWQTDPGLAADVGARAQQTLAARIPAAYLPPGSPPRSAPARTRTALQADRSVTPPGLTGRAPGG